MEEFASSPRWQVYPGSNAPLMGGMCDEAENNLITRRTFLVGKSGDWRCSSVGTNCGREVLCATCRWSYTAILGVPFFQFTMKEPEGVKTCSPEKGEASVKSTNEVMSSVAMLGSRRG